MGSPPPSDLLLRHFFDTCSQLMTFYGKRPEAFLQQVTTLWQTAAQSQPNAAPIDKRFQTPLWEDNAWFEHIKQQYLLITKQVDTYVELLAVEDALLAKKIRFYTHQWLDAMAPSNNAALNPDVIAKTFAAQGENLLQGWQQFLNDWTRQPLPLPMRITDENAFVVGETIACTPGHVIFQNDVMQLIHYTPTTPNTYSIPLLIVPPWINKFYILDLQPHNSLVKWLVDKGYAVFLLSWVNPTAATSHKKFEDYLQDGPLAALKEIERITGQPTCNVLGYCVGGTLLGCLLAYLAKRKEKRVQSATFLTTLLDFSEPGELGLFIDENQVNGLEQHMAEQGYLDGAIMATVFQALRANDLIWTTFVNHYLQGQPFKPFDLLYWNADATNLPGGVHSYYLRHMYLQNALIKPNALTLLGEKIDLTTCRVPSYFLAAEDDHIVPWQASYKSMQALGGNKQFVLTQSGHVAGVVNPPQKQKYGFWSTEKNARTAESYRQQAMFHTGSWWEHWEQWLQTFSGTLDMNDLSHAVTSIEAAPGSYVKVRFGGKSSSSGAISQ